VLHFENQKIFMKKINLEEVFQKIGDNLKTIRGRLKLTIEGVAKDINLTHPVISQIENGRYHGLTMHYLVDLCNLYDTPLNTILQLGDSQIFHFSQKIENGTHTNAQVYNESSSGYIPYIHHLENEIEYLKKVIENK
jgi:transcriptional regulator with XRE-family HTH domain